MIYGCLFSVLASAIVAVPTAAELRGPFPIMSTPYFADASVDYEGLKRELRYVDESGCPGAIWCQSNDAIDLLTREEKRQGFEACAAAAEGRTIVLALGANGTNTAEMLEIASDIEAVAARHPRAKIAMVSRPPDDVRSQADIERAWDALATVAHRPVIFQTFGTPDTPTPDVALLVRLAERHSDIYGYIKEEASGYGAVERMYEENRHRPPLKTLMAGWGGWQMLMQMRHCGCEGLVTERCAYAPALAALWLDYERGERGYRLAESFAMFRFLCDQRNFPAGLRGYHLYLLEKAGVFKNRLSRQYKNVVVKDAGSFGVGREWQLVDVSLTDLQKLELDRLYQDMLDFAATRTGKVSTNAVGVADFTAEWNGDALTLQSARVSAVPFNRIWCGRQRSEKQTKIAYFASFPVEAPGVLTVKLAEGSHHVLPLSFAANAKREGNVLRIAVDRPRQFVVRTGGTELHFFADPPFRHVPAPNEIYFGPGVHDAGVIEPKSGETVCLDAGAVVYGNILVHHAENVKIVGRGILDSSRMKRADHSCEAFRRAVAAGMSPDQYGAEMAVNSLTVYASTNVTVEGVVFRDSPRWTVIVRNGCRNVAFDNVKLIGMWRYNSDGVDFCASEDCSIRNSFIRTFDDCIVARGPYLDGETQDCRRILAEDCVLWCDWGKNLEVWAGHVPGTIADVTYRRCQLVNVSWMACDVTTRYGSPATRIRDVVMEDLEIDYATPPLEERIQRSEDDAFVPKAQAEQCLVRVDCGPVGRNTGNQGIEEGVGTAGLSVRYDNFAFRRFSVLGDAHTDLTRTILTETKPHYRADRIAVEDVPGREAK